METGGDPEKNSNATETELARCQQQLAALRVQLAEQAATIERLKRQEAALATTLRAAPLGIGLVANRVLGWTSQRLQEMVGYSSEELAGQSARILYPDEEEFLRVGRVMRAEVRDKGVGSTETRFLRRDGTVLDVILSSSAIDPRDWSQGLVFTALDVTDFKRVERERDRLFQLSLDMLVVAGLDGRFKDANPAWHRSLGWSRDDLLGRAWSDFVHPEDQRASERARGELVAGRKVIGFEHRWRHRDGTYRWLSWNVFPVPEKDLVFGVARDVTVHRDVLETVRASEQRLRSVIDNSPFGMHMYELRADGSLVFTGANAAAERILGVPHGQFIGKTIEQAFPPLGDTEIPTRYRDVARTGKTFMLEQVDYRDDAIAGAFEVRAFQISKQRMVAAFLDISERKRSAERLRRANADLALLADTAMAFVELPPAGNLYEFIAEKLASITESSVVAVASRDPRTGKLVPQHMVGVSAGLQAAADLLGFDPYSIQVEPDSVLLEHLRRNQLLPFPGGIHAATRGLIPERLCPAIEKVFDVGQLQLMGLTRGREVFGAVAVLTRRGRELPSRPTTEAFVRQAAVAVERQRAEETLREREEELRHAQKMEAVGTLAGGVAHDFNNLLTGILAYANDLRHASTPGEEVYESAAVIENAASRAAELTRQLLGFARKSKIVRQPVDLCLLLGEVVGVLRRTVDKRIAISRQTCTEPAIVLGDASQLQQVLLNLALNACDAMPRGGQLDFIVELSDACPNEMCLPGAVGAQGFVQLSVRDSGVGIPEGIRERVFEPFFTTKPEGKGTGMGLAVVYGIVRAHGGQVTVDSDTSRGTTVRVLIPQCGEEAVAPPRTQAPLAPGQGTVLVVDDEEVIRSLARKILSRLGYNVVTCEDGLAALELFARRHQEIDLVVLDLAMPRMGGSDCLARLRVIDPEVRALISSGYRDDTNVEQLLAGGAVGFLRKPYVVAELAEAVARALRQCG